MPYFVDGLCALYRPHLSRDFCSNFELKMYLGIIYKSIYFGDAAPSVPSFKGSKGYVLWVSSVRSAGHIS